MKLHDLKPAPGSRTAKRRVGRGIAAGQGKTAGRGTKGQLSRTGPGIPHAEAFEINELAVLLDQHDGAGNLAGRDLAANVVAHPVERRA